MSFNLLPRAEQKKVLTLTRLTTIRTLCIVGVLLLGCISILVRTGDSVLSQSARELTTTMTAAQTRSGLKTAIHTLNQDIQTALKIQNEWIPVHLYLETAASVKNEGITLTNLTFLSQEKIIRIQGLAKTRNNLLAYQSALEHSGLFAAIQSPLSNILEPVDITFQFAAPLLGVIEPKDQSSPSPLDQREE